MTELVAEEHRSRADEHRRVGVAILDTGVEWAAVCLFYSAYHHVKAALLDDPIFTDFDALRAVRPDLSPDDRFASAHKVRKGQPGYGVNDLVLLLYPRVAGTYDKLHSMSIDVRYQRGLRLGAIEALPSLFDGFVGAVDQGQLRRG